MSASLHTTIIRTNATIHTAHKGPYIKAIVDLTMCCSILATFFGQKLIAETITCVWMQSLSANAITNAVDLTTSPMKDTEDAISFLQIQYVTSVSIYSFLLHLNIPFFQKSKLK